MSNRRRGSADEAIGLVVLFFLLLIITPFALGFKYYRAGVQQEVYHRQGVEMSRSEIFWGAQPAERAMIPVKDRATSDQIESLKKQISNLENGKGDK
jgi:hypothetical protein